MPSHQSGRAVNQVSLVVVHRPADPAGGRRGVGDEDEASEPRVAFGFCGDGATSQPDFHAAMNFAASSRCPCVIVCQNNHWSISVPTSRQTASQTIAIKGRAYGMPSVRVDGNDLLAVYKVLGDARGARATRRGPDVRRGAHLPHRRALHERRPDALPQRRRGRGLEEEGPASTACASTSSSRGLARRRRATPRSKKSSTHEIAAAINERRGAARRPRARRSSTTSTRRRRGTSSSSASSSRSCPPAPHH